MPAASQQSQQGQQDSGLAPVWITIGIFIVAYLIWHEAHAYIVTFIFFINVLLAKLVDFFVPGSPLEHTIYLMQTMNPAAVNIDQLTDCVEKVGRYIRYPITLVLLVLAFFLYRADITQKFRKTYTMQTLRQQEQYNWSAIMPVVKEDLVSADVSEGPWAMALSPMEFARKHTLLKKEDVIATATGQGTEMTAGIRRGDAKRVFTLQLGSYWTKFEDCPPQMRALAAVFIARLNRDRTAAAKILETLSRSYVTGKMDYQAAYETLNKYKDKDNVQEIIQRHAYQLTVMASLLIGAREDGVVPTSEFLWCRPVDRRLWYLLNSVGRQTPFAEVAGPFAHWAAEKAMKRRSLVPMIDEAIKALEIAVKEVKLAPKEMGALMP